MATLHVIDNVEGRTIGSAPVKVSDLGLTQSDLAGASLVPAAGGNYRLPIPDPDKLSAGVGDLVRKISGGGKEGVEAAKSLLGQVELIMSAAELQSAMKSK